MPHRLQALNTEMGKYDKEHPRIVSFKSVRRANGNLHVNESEHFRAPALVSAGGRTCLMSGNLLDLNLRLHPFLYNRLAHPRSPSGALSIESRLRPLTRLPDTNSSQHVSCEHLPTHDRFHKETTTFSWKLSN